MIAISIPVHENIECVIDLVENIRHYEPRSCIVLHVSRSFSSFDSSILSKYENVFINPKRNQTGLGLLVHHVSNFRFIEKRFDFSHFLIMSSNEMLIKPGLASHMERYKNGFQSVWRHQRPTWHLFNRFQRTENKWGANAPYDFDFVKNPEHITWESDCPTNCPDHRVSSLMTEIGMREIIGGQAEGQFYEREIFGKISDLYEKIWGDENVVGYETEEFIPTMIAKSILRDRKEKQTAPITLQNYSQHISYDKEFIEKAMSEGRDLGLSDMTNPVCLPIPHLKPSLYCPNHEDWSNSSYVFSLKRVPRRYDDPTRKLIRSYYR